MHMVMVSQLPFLPNQPTTTGRRGVGSGLSVLVHAVVLALAFSGLLSPSAVVEPPPAMVVDVVLDKPPPPPALPVQQVLPPPPIAPVRAAKPVPVKAPAAVKPASKASRLSETAPPVAAEAAAPAPAQSPAAVAAPVSAPLPPVAAAPDRSSVDPAIYLPGIKDRVQSMVVYPPLALRRGEHGVVHVKATLGPDGAVLDVSADENDEVSGRLRNAAIKAVQDSAPFPQMANTVKVTIPVIFEIR